MNLPGFTAEKSLQGANASYIGSYARLVRHSVVPQQTPGWCGPCVGGYQRCGGPIESCYRDPYCLFGDLCLHCSLAGWQYWGQPCWGGPRRPPQHPA